VPTVRGIEGPYQFFFYSFDCNEPKHVHVQRERNMCKFWLEPLALAGNDGFAPHELNRIRDYATRPENQNNRSLGGTLWLNLSLEFLRWKSQMRSLRHILQMDG